ncbi:MAG: CARDB domain-containing protein [Candidatus Thermoplasmatota archaeon]|nr:CARDB domain-containing protein [Candidatus Thermoplasmatota archaeon]
MTLADGIWYWRVKTSDSYEWGDWSGYYIIKIDTSLPSSTIQTPSADPAYYNTTAIWLNGTCSDTGTVRSGINRTEIKIVWKDNGTVYLDWTNTNLATNYTWWDYSFLPPNEANFTIWIRAVDNASNYQIAITTNITYDITKPSALIVGLPKYSNSDFTVSWSGSDALSGLKYYTVRYSENNTTSWLDWPGFVETAATSGLWLISNTTEGCIVYFKVIVYDNALNTNTSTTYTIKDTIKPISNILIPEEGYATNESPIEIEGNCSDEKSGINRVEIKITWKDNGTIYLDWTSTNLAANYTWWSYIFYPPSEANYTIHIKAVDNATNHQVRITRNITYDVTNPSASIVPLPKYSNSNFTVSWSGSDALSGLKYYTIQNATTPGDWQDWLVGVTYTSAVWDISKIPEGSLMYFRVIVYDRANNENRSATYTTRDTIKPLSYILVPEEGYATNATPIKIEGNCSDEKSGINVVKIKIVWKDNNTTYKDWIDTNLATNYTWWDYPFYPPNESNYTVYIQAIDNASNSQEGISVNITYDKTPPPAPEPLNPYPSEVTVEGNIPIFNWTTVSDELSGLAYYNIQVSNTSTFTYVVYEKNTTTNTSTPESSFSDGTYYWKVKSVDKAGNANRSEIIKFYIATGAPTIKIFYINNNQPYTNSNIVQLTINITPEAGVRFKMRFSNNKINWTVPIDYKEDYPWDLADPNYGGNSIEGSKRVYIECWKVGGINISASFDEIILDTTPPIIYYNYPSAGLATSWYKSNPGDVIDIDFGWVANSPLDYAQYRIGTGAWRDIFTSDLASDYTSNWLIDWDILAEGENQISLRVADCAGNVLTHNYTAGSSGFLFRKDTRAPSTPSLIFPSNNTTITYNEITFIWEPVTDPLPGSGVAKYKIEIYDIDFQLKCAYDVFANFTTQNLTDGIYYWRVIAVDNASNLGAWSLTLTFTIDTAAPKNLILLINGGMNETNTEDVYLTIYAENADMIKLWNTTYPEPSLWINYTTFLEWRLAPEIPIGSAENRTVLLRCLNSKTYRTSAISATILVNKKPPLARIIEPSQIINVTQFTINWEIITEPQLVAWFELWNESSQEWDIKVEKSTTSFTFYNLIPGYHILSIRAINDATKEHGGAAAILILVDLLPPTNLNITVNGGVLYTNSTSATLDLNAVEDFSVTKFVSGIDKFYISNNGALWLEYNYTKFPATLGWDLIRDIEDKDGSKTVYFKVRDKAGNYALTTATIFLDREKPTNLDLSMLERTNSTSIKLTLSALDPGYPVAGSGIYKMCFSEDGINWGVWINGDWVANGWINYSQSYTYKLQPGNTQDGTKTIYFKVRDYAGNENYVAGQMVLDRAPKLQSPDNYSIISSNTTLLVWERNTTDFGIYSYIVEYDESIGFESPKKFEVNNTQFLISNLTHNTTYYWRVKMIRNGDESFWSQAWCFTVKLPDLCIDTEDISFYPGSIVAIGAEVIINATVHNIGESDAENILVEFWQYYPGTSKSTLLESRTIELIKKGGKSQLSIPYRFSVVEEFGVYVRVDPYNTLSEIRKDNNLAYNILKVVSFPDVLPLSIGLSVDGVIEPSYIFEDDNVTIIAKIKNQGGDIVTSFWVEFWIGNFEDGIFNGTLIGKREVQSITGGQIIDDISMCWVAGVDNYTIRVFLNTTLVFKEKTENNELFRNITVYYKTALMLQPLESLLATEAEGEVSYTIIIENIGLIEDTYNLEIEDLPSDWSYSIIYQREEIDNITLDVGESLQIDLIIKTSKQPTGDTSFKFVAKSRKDPRAVYKAELTTRVITPPPPFPWYLVIFGIIATIIACMLPAVVLKVIRKTAKIDEIFLLYEDGRLIKHFTRRLRPYRDEDILAGMLTAVSGFVKDVFKGEPGMLEEMKFGELKFIIGGGKYIIIAAVLVGKRGVELVKREITKVIAEIERKYEQVLVDWDGDLAKVIPVSKEVEKLLR